MLVDKQSDAILARAIGRTFLSHFTYTEGDNLIYS